MQTLNQNQKNNGVNKKMNKSWLCLIGSLLVIVGITILSFNYVERLRMEVFGEMFIKMSDVDVSDTVDVPEVSNVENENDGVIEPTPETDFSKYVGVLEIPKIGLKRGFYNLNSKLNTVEKNVTLIQTSKMPDVKGGNLILAAHSGDAYISYFAFLHRIKIGDKAFVTYNGIRYEYRIVDIYEVPKVGTVAIRRNYDATTLTLITCTKNSDTTQTVYIAKQL